jgi:hypothetical protein
MNGKYYIAKRSTASLLASGVATLTFDNGCYRIKVDSNRAAMRRDMNSLKADSLRAYRKLGRSLEPA